jgi:hypothetical protein
MRRLATLLLTTVALASGVEPEQPEQPEAKPIYKPLRFNEDYSYLSDPSRRTDPFEVLKYLRLRTDDPAWYLSFGGEVRERVEITSNPDFGFGGVRDGYLLQRLAFHADLHLGKRVRIFVEGISGLIWDEDRPAPPTQDDPAVLQSAFIDLVRASPSDSGVSG